MMNNDTVTTSEMLAKYYKNACLAEIEAIKPGNVHVFADGHGMQVQDFIQSAEVSAIAISNPDLTLGERIYQSVDATWQAVGCNTNLGIILLAAPIIQCRLQSRAQPLAQQLDQLLSSTTIEDADWVFKAIVRANPAGLGQSDEHDVNHQAKGTLLAAMQASAEKDLIALQYSNGFFNILNEGLPQYQEALSRLGNAAWAVTALYLYWLSHHLDSHIVRKHNLKLAQQVQQQAALHYEAFNSIENPKRYFAALFAFDQDLKREGINPGTSADLTVATIFAHAAANI